MSFTKRSSAAWTMGDGNYLILLAHDTYDVSYDPSAEVFLIICGCVCPVKDGKLELGYCPEENDFHSCAASQVVSPPELGFLFSAFDDWAANIYNALADARKPDELHQEFLAAIFPTEPLMSPAALRETF